MNYDEMREAFLRPMLNTLESYESLPEDIRGFPAWLFMRPSPGDDAPRYQQYLIQPDPCDMTYRGILPSYEARITSCFISEHEFVLVWITRQDDHRLLQAKYFVDPDPRIQRSVREALSIARWC